MERKLKRKTKKGQMRVVEVILASFIITFALSFANILAITPTSPRYKLTELQKMGYNVLHDLNKQGLLAQFVYKNEWENLEAALRVLLPLDVYFNLTVYDLQGNKINNQTIFYGTTESFQNSENIASITYGLPGYPTPINNTYYQANYDPTILLLQLTRG